MSVSADEYCMNICGGKCCKPEDYKCPNLTVDNKCGIYTQWKDNWCHYKDYDNFKAALPIKMALAKGKINKVVADQCCYAHPELLEKSYGN